MKGTSSRDILGARRRLGTAMCLMGRGAFPALGTSFVLVKPGHEKSGEVEQSRA